MTPVPAVAAAGGFFGKVPARGDFVRSGLPASFIAAWDGWIVGVMAGSLEILAKEWISAWLEAPIWRFALPDGMCGPDAAVGLFMPSVDRAGRYFPLCFARLARGTAPAAAAGASSAWLAAAEAAGLAAVADDLAPEAVAARLAMPERDAADVALPPAIARAPQGRSLWWTRGSPRVAAGGFALGSMPGPRCFAGMLDARFAAATEGAAGGDEG
jgi:type VI secretion system protein ImpM